MRGKLIWKSLKTDRISVAKLRLGDFHKGERQRAATHSAVARGKMAFAQALETFRERLKGDYSLKDRSKVYREEQIAALLKSWPELEATDVAQVSKAECLSWAARFGQKASPSAFNSTVALAMKTYGHLRDQHSTPMPQFKPAMRMRPRLQEGGDPFLSMRFRARLERSVAECHLSSGEGSGIFSQLAFLFFQTRQKDCWISGIGE